jgi:hypothetical protein
LFTEHVQGCDERVDVSFDGIYSGDKGDILRSLNERADRLTLKVPTVGTMNKRDTLQSLNEKAGRL